MARSVEPLVVGRVIGDVIDLFSPSLDLSVSYETKQVANGCEIKPSAAVDRPRVQIKLGGCLRRDGGLPLHVQSHGKSPGGLYTLVMTDPDAPSPSEPTMREWLHWIVVDIPGGSDATKGREVVAYMGPRPPTGIHRYVFALFQQTAAAQRTCVQEERHNFSTRRFAYENGLGLPVAAVYFNSQKEPASKKR